MKNQIRLPRKIASRFELIFLKLSSASDWIICTKECALIKSGHTFGLLAVNSPAHAMNKIFEKTQSKTVKTSQNCTKIIKSTSGKANITEGRLGTKNIEPAGQIAHVQRHERLNRL